MWFLKDDRSSFDEGELHGDENPDSDPASAVHGQEGRGRGRRRDRRRAARGPDDQSTRGSRHHLYNEQGKLRSFVNVYLNDEDIRYLQKEQTPVSAGDTISIIPSVAGGAAVR